MQGAAAAKNCHADGVVDAILNTLAQFTMPADPGASYPRAVVDFGSSLLARDATFTLFGIAAEHADQMRAGWATCLACVLRLHQLRLVEPSVFSDAQVRHISQFSFFRAATADRGVVDHCAKCWDDSLPTDCP